MTGLATIIVALALPIYTTGKATGERDVCHTRWGHDRRHVTLAMKMTVAKRYGVLRTQWRRYEFDHLIPRELGGADDIENLWPQPLAEARAKDRIENRLHRAVCAGMLTLPEAQGRIVTWWKEER